MEAYSMDLRERVLAACDARGGIARCHRDPIRRQHFLVSSVASAST